MKKVRKSTFETNSSSTHSLVFCTEDEYNGLQNETLYIDNDTDKICNLVEAKHIVISAYMAYNDIKDINISEEKYWEDNHENIEEYWTDNSYELPVLLEDWLGEELETDTYRYTTKLGEKIVAIAKYGCDN